MIRANSQLFSSLSDFAASRGYPIVQGERFVQGDLPAQQRLQRGKIQASHAFGRRRAAAVVRLPAAQGLDEGTEAIGDADTATAFAFVGFESELSLDRTVPMDPDPGTWVVCMLELGILPNASPQQIRDVVEAGSKSDSGYTGHEPIQMYGLFPSLQLLAVDYGLTVDDFWPAVLVACLQDCELGVSWIDDHLAGQLEALATLDVPGFPYDFVCRSVLDMDERSMFLALYRVLEGLYAYAASTRLVAELGLTHHWTEVARALQTQLRWRPRAEDSLQELLGKASPADCERLCQILSVPEGEGSAVRRAASALYALRNRVVHNQLHLDDVKPSEVEWNQLCAAMAGIAFDVTAAVR